MRFSAFVAACALLLCFPALAETLAPATSPTAPSPPGVPSLDDFYAKPVFSAASLSPDGRHLAYAQGGDGPSLMIRDLDTGETRPILDAKVKGTTIDWIDWKDDNRLVLGITLLDIKRAGDKTSGYVLSYKYGRLLMAVDRDGKNSLQLLKANFTNGRRGGDLGLLDHLWADPDHILAMAPDNEGNIAIWKVNIRTGEAALVDKGSAKVTGWRTDSTGAVVLRYRIDGDDYVLEGRPKPDAPWSKIITVRVKDPKELADFEIFGPADKPGQFYVATKPKTAAEGDFRRLRVYDVASKTFSEPVWPALKYDITNIVYDGDTYRLAGVCYTVDVSVCDLADKTEMAHFKGLLTYFGGDRNIDPISISKDGAWWLLEVSGSNEPSSYYLYDKGKANIQLLAERYDKLPDEKLGVMRRFVYPARDGVQIPAYITRPPNAPAGPMPLIVMPHGGPEARDTMNYDVWSQYLATRGYLVFQPNFRGSGGYGVSYGEAGYKQWGGRMADDITDGVKKLIDSGQADPNRICIFGASYGGFAALYAGATHPELYKCVVSVAGPTDLVTEVRQIRSDYGDDSSTYKYWIKSKGDPDKDAAMMRAASPITYAATYKPPVLLIHGEYDRIVLPVQSALMKHALETAGRDVRLITLKNEGHPHWEDDDEKATLTEIDKFIEAHIAPAALKPPAVPPTTPPKP